VITLTLTHTQHETLRECVATQLKRTESLASLMLAEHRAEPEENKRARIELALTLGLLDGEPKGSPNEMPTLQ
jgi:hypothetical protein